MIATITAFRYRCTALSIKKVSKITIIISGMLMSHQVMAIGALELVNIISPAGGVGVSKDIAYGEHPAQHLDIYYPKALALARNQGRDIQQRYPLVLFVHGGSWKNGNKDQYAFVGQSLAQAGYVTAVINYRKAPEFVYPTFVEDTAQAIAWTHQNADKFDADANNMAVVGHSAGAFNALAAMSNQRFLAPFGIQPSDIKAVVGIAGPYSYDFRTSDSRSVFPVNATPDEVMPDRLIQSGRSGRQPSYLLLTAENDKVMGAQNTQRMAQALQAVQAEVTVSEIKGASHATSIGAMAGPLRGLNDVRQQLLAYLERTLTNQSNH